MTRICKFQFGKLQSATDRSGANAECGQQFLEGVSYGRVSTRTNCCWHTLVPTSTLHTTTGAGSLYRHHVFEPRNATYCLRSAVPFDLFAGDRLQQNASVDVSRRRAAVNCSFMSTRVAATTRSRVVRMTDERLESRLRAQPDSVGKFDHAALH